MYGAVNLEVFSNLTEAGYVLLCVSFENPARDGLDPLGGRQPCVPAIVLPLPFLLLNFFVSLVPYISSGSVGLA